MSTSPKTTGKLYEYSRNNSISKSFQWCPLSCLHLTVTISYHHYYMNLVLEKLYFGQWSYITNIYPVNAICLLKFKQCRIKHNMRYLSSKLNYCSNFISFGRKWGLMVWFTPLWFIYSNSSHVGWLMCHRIHLKDDLCQVWLKLTHWFQKIRFFKYRTEGRTDGQDTKWLK